MYDDDILFEIPPLFEVEDELRLQEHAFEQEESEALSAPGIAEIEAALAVLAVLDMEIDDEEEERPLLLH